MTEFLGVKECLPWFLAGGLGHIGFDVLTYAAIFVFGAKVGKWKACKHRKEPV